MIRSVFGRDMPTLAEAERLLSVRAVNARFQLSRGPFPKTEFGLYLGACRVTDHAIEQFGEARVQLERWRLQADEASLVRGVSAIECAVVSTDRAVKFLEALRRRGLRHTDGRPVVASHRELPLLSDKVRKRISDVRDDIQHLDERVLRKDDIGAQPINLLPGPEAVDGMTASIRYDEWADWLRTLHRVLWDLADLEAQVSATEADARDNDACC